MGIPTERFVSPPGDNVLCAVCLDGVMEDPYSLTCGHSFCKGCIERFRQSSCPTCRKVGAKETAHRSFALRDIIGDLEVYCLHCAVDSSSEPAAKRQKAEDSDVEGSSKDEGLPWWAPMFCRLTGYQLFKAGDPSGNRSENDRNQSVEQETKPSAKRARDFVGCTWTGKLSDWDSHAQNECQFHPVPCLVPGCTVRCPRKDMKQHMEDSMLKHLDLIAKAKVAVVKKELEAKVATERKETEIRFDAKLNAIQRQVAALKNGPAAPEENTTAQQGADGTNDGPPVQIVVANAGLSIVNGTYDYVRDGARDRVMEGSFMYVKEVTWEGAPAEVYIYRHVHEDWFMSIVLDGDTLNNGDEIDLYQFEESSSSTIGGRETLPPLTGWEPSGNGSPGALPAPTMQFSPAPNVRF